MTPRAMNRTDRRVLKTRQAILKAFLSLLERMPYEKITISALAREADIDRKTFYLHYESVDALLEEIMDAKLASVLEESEVADDETLMQFLTRVNHAFHCAVIGKQGMLNNLTSDAILNATRNVLMKAVLTSPFAKRATDPEELALATAFTLGGVVGAYRMVLAQENTRPFEEISAEIEQLSLMYVTALVERNRAAAEAHTPTDAEPAAVMLP